MRKEAVTFTFQGDLPVASFAEFAQHRAARLSLDLHTIAQNSTNVTLRVKGPADLVDAFEMAMSLGPTDCIVSDVHRQDNAPYRSETE